MGENNPPSTSNEIRAKGSSSKENTSPEEVQKSTGRSTSQTSGKRPATGHAPKDNTIEGRSSVTLNTSVLASDIAEALKGSLEGLRDSMTTGFLNLGKLITAHSVGNGEADSGDEDDSNESKDEEESPLEGEPPAKKKKPDEPGKDKNPLMTKLTKTLHLTEHVGPTIDGDLASLVDKIMRESK